MTKDAVSPVLSRAARPVATQTDSAAVRDAGRPESSRRASSGLMTTSVIVATRGRAEHVACLLDRLARQTVLPVRVILSVVDESDLPSDLPPDPPFSLEVLTGPAGLTKQRNRGLERAEGDIVAFFDDDFVPSRHAIDAIAAAFETHPEIGGVTGALLADGINGPGLTSEEAAALVDRADESYAVGPPRLGSRLEGLYGCNMAYRASAIEGLRFDERLPLYGWQEDIDFSGQLALDNVRLATLIGVHCGTKRGRERSGRKLGYSQIANPLYLARKGTMSWQLALRHMSRNMTANHLKLFFPEPWVDRRGRAEGNWRALWDTMRGRVNPERILEL